MSALSSALERAMRFAVASGLDAPFTQVRMIEVNHLARDSRGRCRVRRKDLRAPGEYEARFDELLSLGFPWINLWVCGVLGDSVIVAVELPRTRPEQPCPVTSVDHSGPTERARAAGWSAAEDLALE
jgi:hypothetical protein